MKQRVSARVHPLAYKRIIDVQEKYNIRFTEALEYILLNYHSTQCLPSSLKEEIKPEIKELNVTINNDAIDDLMFGME